MTGWYVVKFTKEKNLIEVIPSNWIHNFKECLWPEKLGTLKLQVTIKNRSRPSDDWKLHPIKVISKQMYIMYYSDASKCADKTLALTSSASETELTQNQSINKRKRTCKADNYNGLSSSSDEEQSTAHNIPDFPNFTSSKLILIFDYTLCQPYNIILIILSLVKPVIFMIHFLFRNFSFSGNRWRHS